MVFCTTTLTLQQRNNLRPWTPGLLIRISSGLCASQACLGYCADYYVLGTAPSPGVPTA